MFVGEIYNSRHRVLRKLGFGAYSTVWMVKDVTTDRYLAMKVLSAEAYGGKQNDIFELEILHHLQTADPALEGHKHVLHPLDEFERDGPNGRYVCMVFPVFGEDLLGFRKKFSNDYSFPGKILKRFVKQLLLALDYAHSSGVIHTDITPQNIMIKMKDESFIGDWYISATEGYTEPKAQSQEIQSSASSTGQTAENYSHGKCL